MIEQGVFKSLTGLTLFCLCELFGSVCCCSTEGIPLICKLGSLQCYIYLTLPVFHQMNRKMDSKFSHNRKIEQLSVELPAQPRPPHLDSSRDHALQFNRGQPSDKDLDPADKLEFGGYIARQAMIDEDYWVSNDFLCHKVLIMDFQDYVICPMSNMWWFPCF